MTQPLEGWADFPRIGLRVEGIKKFYPLREAIPLWDAGMLNVEETGELLESDFTVRRMTPQENAAFQARVDEYSGSK